MKTQNEDASKRSLAHERHQMMQSVKARISRIEMNAGMMQAIDRIVDVALDTHHAVGDRADAVRATLEAVIDLEHRHRAFNEVPKFERGDMVADALSRINAPGWLGKGDMHLAAPLTNS